MKKKTQDFANNPLNNPLFVGFHKTKEKIEEPKGDFLVMADFAGAWGWDRHKDETSWVLLASHLTDKIEGVYINQTLLKKLAEWVWYFEANYRNPQMDWDNFNKTGVRLAILLKKQIGHLYDKFYYDPPFEDWTTRKYHQNVRIEIINH